MPHDELHTYMNDHLAGAVVGLKVLDRLIGTTEEPSERAFFTNLRQEIDEDRSVLAGLLERVGGHISGVRQAGAWVSEKLTEVKLRLDDPGGRGLNHLESLEALALGILGKRALWRALDGLAAEVPELGHTDFGRLERRAEDQHDRVDARRIAAARRIFGRRQNVGAQQPDE